MRFSHTLFTLSKPVARSAARPYSMTPQQKGKIAHYLVNSFMLFAGGTVSAALSIMFYEVFILGHNKTQKNQIDSSSSTESVSSPKRP